MTASSPTRRRTLLSCVALALLIAGPPAWAQEPEPGTPLYGRPKTPGAMRLDIVPPQPLPPPADKLPTAKLKVPEGFKIETYVAGIRDARFIAEGDKGTVFVSNWQGNNVYAVIDKGGKREVKALYKGLDWPNGIAFKDGTLYIAEHTKISKAENIEDHLDNPPKLVAIYTNLPDPRPHGWRQIAIGPDNRLYIAVGAPCNICMPPDTNAQIRSMTLDGKDVQIVARGVRNTLGFDWHPVSGEMYFTDNGRDWLSEDIPNDELNRVTQPGKENFGFPYCHQGNIPDSEFGWGHKCTDYTPPIALLGPHAAALGMTFYTGSQFPEKYKNAIFVARHGSWNRTIRFGGDVVAVHLDNNGNLQNIEPFVTGFIEDNKYLGRPVGVFEMKDGSLLITDDHNGAVYRVSYGK
jgi:glucose/arabinose dehydrogenase